MITDTEQLDPEQLAIKAKVEDYGKHVIDILNVFEKEDGPDRERFLRKIKKNLLFWRGIQHIFWSESSDDFRNTLLPPEIGEEEIDPGQFEYILNIFRAHGESIIAATGAALPYIRFMPDDATNADDLASVEEYDRAVDLLQKHNEAKLLFLRSFYIHYLQGLIAIYNYHKKDKEFGTYNVDVMDKMKVPMKSQNCPECGADLTEAEDASDSYVDESTEAPQMMIDEKKMCPDCGPVKPEVEEWEEEVSYVSSQEERPKGREIVEAYGPVNVLIPLDARNQAEIPYLILEHEIHPSLAKEQFPIFEDEIGEGSSTGEQTFYRYARRLLDEEISITYRKTVRKVWLRPFSYRVLDKETELILRQAFPHGIYACVIDDKVVHIEDKGLDECWTIIKHPMSDYLQDEPPAGFMVDVQKMENDLANLTMQTIYFGINQKFADPSILDFNAYRQTEARVGQIFQAQGRSGQPLSNYFYETKNATLSREVETFRVELNRKAQFISGDMPSIHGGPATSGSKTLGEYEIARAQSLQRLSITREVVVTTWRKAFAKATYSYCYHLKQDGYNDRMVKRGADNKFANIDVNYEKLNGKVGGVEPESNEQFPLTWEQQRVNVMSLMDGKQPAIMATLFHPNNIDYMSKILGLRELFIPGREDQVRQLEEIQELLENNIPPEIDPVLDDHAIHAQVTKAFLLGSEGQRLRKEESDKYMILLQHYQQHMMALQGPSLTEPEPTIREAPPASPATSAASPLPSPGGPEVSIPEGMA